MIDSQDSIFHSKSLLNESNDELDFHFNWSNTWVGKTDLSELYEDGAEDGEELSNDDAGSDYILSKVDVDETDLSEELLLSEDLSNEEIERDVKFSTRIGECPTMMCSLIMNVVMKK